MIEDEIFEYIQQKGQDITLYDKACKFLMLGDKKLYAYYVQCEYIVGQQEDGQYIIDTQNERALYLEK